MKGVQSVTADRERILITSIEPQELSVSRFNECLVFYRKGLRLPLRRQVGERAEFVVVALPLSSWDGVTRRPSRTRDLYTFCSSPRTYRG